MWEGMSLDTDSEGEEVTDDELYLKRHEIAFGDGPVLETPSSYYRACSNRKPRARRDSSELTIKIVLEGESMGRLE